ncbi:hypothetical protein [Paenibacillus castaneae]|uniref:hypothetical protein n=1 Tax=Paenibacillus castaneae TaxID=474957 RepID=UPI001FBA2358|nr:hypothetical protein [Paenibacillus castaneae]
MIALLALLPQSYASVLGDWLASSSGKEQAPECYSQLLASSLYGILCRFRGALPIQIACQNGVRKKLEA